MPLEKSVDQEIVIIQAVRFKNSSARNPRFAVPQVKPGDRQRDQGHAPLLDPAGGIARARRLRGVGCLRSSAQGLQQAGPQPGTDPRPTSNPADPSRGPESAEGGGSRGKISFGARRSPASNGKATTPHKPQDESIPPARASCSAGPRPRPAQRAHQQRTPSSRWLVMFPVKCPDVVEPPIGFCPR